MKLSKASSYALHALMYMVRHSTLLPVPIKVMAKAEDIPREYLAKIFQLLVKKQIVISQIKGRGGYDFARPPKQISVLEVLEAVEGESIFEECFLKHSDCEGIAENCNLFQLWQEATAKLRESLSKMYLTEVTWAHPLHTFNTSSEKV